MNSADTVESHVPIIDRQLATDLRKRIIPAGEALPSERALYVQTGASRVAVRKAIERLTRRPDGHPVELTRSAYRGERYEVISELRGMYTLL
jgi:DNA-binding GntR family transcriptional regulator